MGGVESAKCGPPREKNSTPLQPTNRAAIGGNDSILIIALADNSLAPMSRLQRALYTRSCCSSVLYLKTLLTT